MIHFTSLTRVPLCSEIAFGTFAGPFEHAATDQHHFHATNPRSRPNPDAFAKFIALGKPLLGNAAP